MSGKRVERRSIADEWDEKDDVKLNGEAVVGLGGENRTGDEEEQRILLDDTLGGDEGRSSKKDDLFPHTTADMFDETTLW
jgi:hypothetical protein